MYMYFVFFIRRHMILLSLLTVTRYYADVEGLVDLRSSGMIGRFVGSSNRSDRPHKLQQSQAINDCFYRNMYRFERISVIDFDEVGTTACRYDQEPAENQSTFPEC